MQRHWSIDRTLGGAPGGVEPFEFVRLREAHGWSAGDLRQRLVVLTLHDGEVVPKHLVRNGHDTGIDPDQLYPFYVNARDWGANSVAEQLAGQLGLEGYYRVNVARIVMDFNRFPGSSPREASPLDRFAISEPFAQLLDHEAKRRVLEDYYDTVSQGVEAVLDGALIVISIHTYDARNLSQTLRPEISLLSRSHSYQHNSRLPFGLFDPLFPDVLVESSAKHILRDRIALTLEKADLHVEHNYPYCLPDGSLEVRCQPWLFFQHIRRHFEAEHPESISNPAFARVWDMLLNTNLRRGESGTLSGHLHRFRSSPDGLEPEFGAARGAYEAITHYVRDHDGIVHAYKRSPNRTSVLSIEVRKDLVWRFDGDQPVGPTDEKAAFIGEALARAVSTYLKEDR